MYDIFEQLLQNFGISAYKFCKDTGISQSTISTWKKKRNLISGEEKEGGERYYLNDETAQMAQKLFQNKELRVLFDAAQDASPEDLKTTYDMLMALKKKERGTDVD